MSVSRTVSAIFSVMAFNWVTCYSRPLNTVPFESLRTVSYSHSIIHSNYGPILYYFRDKARYWSKIVIFAARCYTNAAYAVMRCPSVRVSVTFVYSVKTNKHIFKISSPSGSHTILVFTYKTLWKYSDRNSSNGGIECRLAMQKSRFWANIWLHRVLWTPSAIRSAAKDHSEKTTLVAGKRRSLLMAEDSRAAFNCTQLSGKSEAEVTIIEDCARGYYTVEANYWQTQSIARPVCDSRATCFITLHRSELPLRAVKTEIWRSFCFYANNEIVENSKFGHGNRLIEFSMTLH